MKKDFTAIARHGTQAEYIWVLLFASSLFCYVKSDDNKIKYSITSSKFHNHNLQLLDLWYNFSFSY